MKFTLKKFYSNNYKDFIHLEALKNILRQVPRLKLAEVKNIDNILSMEFSVDEWGENPMYIKYIDTDGKKHIVKIRPAVTEQIYEILKEYAKITYVDEQDQKVKDELRVEISEGDENTLNLSKEYTDTVVNNAKAELNLNIETAKEDLKAYCDNKCELALIASKNYTDAKADELHQRIDEEHEYNERNYLKGIAQLRTETGSFSGERGHRIQILEHATTTALDAKYQQYVHRLTLDELIGTGTSAYYQNLIGGYILTQEGLRKLDQQFMTNLTNITLSTGDSPLFVSDIAFTLAQYNDQDFMWANIKDGVNDLHAILINEENMQKLYNLDLSGYASKEELDALDSKVDLINQQVEENKTNIENNSNRIDDANQLITDNDTRVSEELGNINDKLDNLPRSSEVTRKGGVFKERLNVETDTPNDFYSSVYLEQRDGTDGEFAGRLVKGDVARKQDLDALSEKVDKLPTTKDDRLSEIPETGKATYVNWYPDRNINYIHLVDDEQFTRLHINRPDGNETIGYLPKSKVTGGSGDNVDHTLSVVTEGDDVVSESDTPVKAVRFAPLVLSGSTETPNHVSVESTQGTKVFNFLPNNVTEYWFDYVNDEMSSLKQNLNNLQTTHETDISNINLKLTQLETIINGLGGGSKVTIDKQDFAIKFSAVIFQGTGLLMISNFANTTLHVTSITVDDAIYRFYNTGATVDINSQYAQEYFDNMYETYDLIQVTAEASNADMKAIRNLQVTEFPEMNITTTASATTQAGLTVSETTTQTLDFGLFSSNPISFNLPHATIGTNKDMGFDDGRVRITVSGMGTVKITE